MDNSFLEYLKTAVEIMYKVEDEQDFLKSLDSSIGLIEFELEKLQTAKYNPDKYGYTYNDEQFDVVIAHHQHMLERKRLMILEFKSKSKTFSRLLCEKLMVNAVSHREIIEEMMESDLINENIYNDESKKLMNHYNRVKEIKEMYDLIYDL